jgi:hypothetical protein
VSLRQPRMVAARGALIEIAVRRAAQSRCCTLLETVVRHAAEFFVGGTQLEIRAARCCDTLLKIGARGGAFGCDSQAVLGRQALWHYEYLRAMTVV